MLFSYHALDKDGHERDGTVEALSVDVAVSTLQRRGLIVSSIEPAVKKSILNVELGLFKRVSNKEIVILSRQIATLFEAQVSALRIFRLLAAEVDNKYLSEIMTQVADDLQGGSPISKALGRHPKVFTGFYVNMVRSGEESGKLSETFGYLADYLDRTYEVMSKAQNALIYPAFVIGVFFVVMGLMLTLVIPRISSILKDSGQEIPMYTQVVIFISDALVHYGFLVVIALAVLVFISFRALQTPNGKLFFDKLKLDFPYIGDLYQKLYLSRIADNFATMLVSGVPVVEAVEITASVVGSSTYELILKQVGEDVKGGSSISDALGRHAEIPGIMTAMVRVGEETGELGNILTTLAKFYRREVSTAVDTLVDLIEPLMIVILGLGVGTLLASVLIPIYNLAGSIS
ncbi:type II secretion system F family protein [Patescibacteria group bacterium]|nr:type II secretion system F family protein [Patescibacteria group bacterium]MBU2158576.1 type II secretion system F family protein [Patescibacteria group bacterium]MBU2220766.1 type II secretion system F family protein [Patescibacteria group bacterium]